MSVKQSICHLTSVHSRKDGRIFMKECRTLSSVGYSVSLIVSDGLGDEEFSGINIYGVKKVLNRFLRIFLSPIAIYKKALDMNADIYHLHDPELLSIALKLKRKGKIVIFDSHEDVPAQIMSKKWIPFFFRKPISLAYSFYEQFILRKIDAVISVSPNIVERLKIINENSILITNYPIVKDLVPCPDMGSKNICFAGQISPLWMHENILKALEKIDEVKYNIAGPNNVLFLNKLKQFSSWKDVNYVGKLSPDQVEMFIQQNRIGMALYDYCEELGFNIGTLGNTKLFEYMKAGIPVICTDFILWKEIVEKINCGICVNPRNVDEIVKAIEYLTNNTDVAKQMGINGQRAVSDLYNWETQAPVLISLYNIILKKNEYRSNTKENLA